MALGPRLDLRQSQQLVMTPQLQQAIKLLAASNLEIETFIGEALESNPLLEAGAVSREDTGPSSEPDDIPREEFTSDQLMAQAQGESEAPLDIDVSAIDRDRETGDGARMSDAEWGSAGGSGLGADDLPGIEASRAAELSLSEHLDAQIGALACNEQEAFVARHIAGLLDDAGYLPTSLREVAQDLGVDMDSVEDALEVVQMCDPTGVGARDLAECLRLQAKEADRLDPCMDTLLDNLDLVAKGEVARLKRLCQVDDEDFSDMLRELREYDPKPGLAFAPASDEAVVPDVLVTSSESGGWDIKLNEATLPRLVVNRSYYVELESGSPGAEAQSWLKEKLADAHWLIRALDQRQKTILKTAAEIVKQQEGFFRRGVSELKPLTLREVAEEIDMHESTVSRVTSNKYLHCDRGSFELKYFFSSGVARVGGSGDGEGASSEAIKARIKALTDAEDPKKVLSDQKLADLLKEEGFDLARRTVAKYREAIGIGSSAQRRRAKKLAGL
ncbi:DNA-directed RNA polymerase subunit N [Erythrobacter sp. NAP1]|uniref:RNA polymerase factor sigma-54 n=1 Tax=Erythrobacter sp. NAP1 TaxID=237727 RepID=UPI0000687890|nr:RNA polymerase factor sigma-54 [Erythrobacter sp. NAP1]EAQ28298.1 DNA-directed RNA polymerase subunit N [Erythrobacter sp. NAP1]